MTLGEHSRASAASNGAYKGPRGGAGGGGENGGVGAHVRGPKKNEDEL